MNGKFSTEISREWIAHALREFGKDLPGDATLVGMEYKADGDVYECVFESDEVPAVHEAATVPRLHRLEE